MLSGRLGPSLTASPLLLLAARRHFSFTNGVGWGVSIPQLSGPGGIFVTKYRVTRPNNENTSWDDFLLALPEKNQLARTTKEIPLFLRFLKLVTDKENRAEAFSTFYGRCKDGLTVESDVFLTTDELLAVMWKNGYSDQERNALQFTFPSDYRFHYPEIAVLFAVDETDAYKFCMRSRMEKSHIGELDHQATKRKGVLRDHWLVYMTGWYIFKNYPFYNYMFFVKTWGFSLWFVSMWMLAGRFAHNLWQRNEYMLQQKTATAVMEGEDKIVESMKKFANDSKCAEYLSSFKPETQRSLAAYRKALIGQRRHELTERMNAQLAAIARFEAQVEANLHDILVKETAKSFKEKFLKDEPQLYQASVDSAIAFLGDKKDVYDPILKHFKDSLTDLNKIPDLMKAPENPNGSLAERVAHQQQQSERDFARTFMVTGEEVAEVKAIGNKATLEKDGMLDFSPLDSSSLKRLEELYKIINNKVGFPIVSEASIGALPSRDSGDSEADTFAESVQAKMEAVKTKLRNERLTAFVNGF